LLQIGIICKLFEYFSFVETHYEQLVLLIVELVVIPLSCHHLQLGNIT